MKQKEYLKYITEEDRMRVRIEIEKGSVVDVVIQYETLHSEKWQAVLRYDCTHGFFHRDVLNRRGEEIKKQQVPIEDLKVALQYAQQDIFDHWKFYKERFLKMAKR